jgi:hypothetical protein
VFADLGLENPVEPLARAALVQSICDIIAERKLTQARAAMLLGIDQPRVAPPNSLDSELSVCHNRHIMSTGVNEDSRPFAGAIYVLHAFQKKSKTGIKTPKAETELIRRRLKAAEKNHEQRTAEEERRRSDQH